MSATASGGLAPGRPRRVIEYRDVVRVGKKQFVRDGGLDLGLLAEELAVSRATLYRVVAGRDQLLGDVLWELALPMLTSSLAGAEEGGIEGLLAGTRHFFSTLMSQEVFRAFLDSEPDAAIRVLFTPAGGLHARVVDVQREAFGRAATQGLSFNADLDGLAELYVRIYESMLYADLLSARPPDLDLAERAARAVLRDAITA